MTLTIDWGANQHSATTILNAIGRTPLVQLNRISAHNAEILVKLEYFGPTGSLKDRIYYNMFSKAEARGDLRRGMTVLECSTGNAGIACSFIAAVKGYQCLIVMPQGMSEERKKMDIAYGARVVSTPGGESDIDLALKKLAEIRGKNPKKYWVPSQFDNSDNVEGHYQSTGPEIWEQTGGQLDAYVATQGTGGQLTGIGRYLRERDSSVRLFAVEPAECPLLSRQAWGQHKIEGIGDGFVPRNLDLSILNGIISVSSDEAIKMAKRLARREGIFCGISSGANVAAAIKLAKRHRKMRRIVTMICDSGQRYFSTELCGVSKTTHSLQRAHQIDRYTRAQINKYQSNWEIIER